MQGLFAHFTRSGTIHDRSKNPHFWSVGSLPHFPPPQTLFKTKSVVEGFWKGDGL
jgi:hypothetical protein